MKIHPTVIRQRGRRAKPIEAPARKPRVLRIPKVVGSFPEPGAIDDLFREAARRRA